MLVQQQHKMLDFKRSRLAEMDRRFLQLERAMFDQRFQQEQFQNETRESNQNFSITTTRSPRAEGGNTSILSATRRQNESSSPYLVPDKDAAIPPPWTRTYDRSIDLNRTIGSRIGTINSSSRITPPRGRYEQQGLSRSGGIGGAGTATSSLRTNLNSTVGITEKGSRYDATSSLFYPEGESRRGSRERSARELVR